MAISSEYYKDLTKVEKKVWGITLREVKAYLCLVGITLLLLLEVFFLPTW
ncbi:type III secretion system protein PrgI, partial [Enterococcus faecalis]